jgi:hypothetical protein
MSDEELAQWLYEQDCKSSGFEPHLKWDDEFFDDKERWLLTAREIQKKHQEVIDSCFNKAVKKIKKGDDLAVFIIEFKKALNKSHFLTDSYGSENCVGRVNEAFSATENESERLKDHRPLVTEVASVATHSSTTRPGGSTVNVGLAQPIDSRGRKQNEPASVATHQCKNCGEELYYNEELEVWYHKGGNCKCNIRKYAEPSDGSLAKTNYQELPKPTESVETQCDTTPRKAVVTKVSGCEAGKITLKKHKKVK